MKKLLSILATFGLTATAGISVVACGKKPNPPIADKNIDVDKQIGVQVGKIKTTQIKNAEELKNIKVKSSNSDIVTASVDDEGLITLTGVKDGNANVVVSADNAAEDATIEVTVQPIPHLRDLIKNKDLGRIIDAKPVTVLAAVEAKNVGSKGKVKVVSVDEGKNTAIIEAVDANEYQGQVEVTFAIIPMLSELVAVTNLGNISNAEEPTILAAVIAKNDGAAGKVKVVSVDEGKNTALIGAVDANEYQGQVEVTFAIIPMLSNLIQNKDLGNIANANEDTILEVVIAKNDGAAGKVEVVSVDEGKNTALIGAVDANEYQGQVEVNFVIIPMLSELVQNKDLGSITDAEEPTILAAVETKNPNAVGKVKVVLVDEGKNTAIIEAVDANEYQGQVEVTFAIIPMLDDLIQNKDLGKITDTKEETVLAAVVEKNNGAADKVKVVSVDQEKNIALIGAINPAEYQGQVEVNFVIIPMLSELVKVTDLDKIANDNESTILEAVIAKNVGAADKVKVVSVDQEKNTALIEAINPAEYQGQVEVNFVIIPMLDDLVKNKDLGKITDAKEETVLAAVEAKNPNAAGKVKVVSVDQEKNTALIGAVDANEYQGQVEVTFAIIPMLDELIKNKDLGNIANANEDTILEAVIAKNDGVDGKVEVVSVDQAENTAVIGAVNSDEYQGQVEVTFVIIPMLSELVKVTDLGSITDAKEETVLEAVEAKNPIAVGKVKVISVDQAENTAVIGAVNSDEYQGQVEVTFAIIPMLDELIKNKDLGNIANANEDTILEAVIAKNDGAEGKVEVVSVDQINQSALIGAVNSNEYQGQVNVTFAIIPMLSELVKVTDLGSITDAKEETVLEAVETKNPNAVGKVKVVSVDEEKNTAIIEAVDANEYQGQVNVTFTIIPMLDELIKNKDLGNISDAEEPTILAAVIAKNDGADGKVKVVSVDREKNTAVIGPVNPAEYQGQVEVNFGITPVVKDLSELVKVTDLGNLPNNDPETILAKVIELNEGTEGKIDIQEGSITENGAVIISTTPEYEGEVPVEFSPEKISLASVLTNLTIEFQDLMDYEYILMDANQRITDWMNKDSGVKEEDLKDPLLYGAKEGEDYLRPSFKTEHGFIKYYAEEESKYYGSVTADILPMKPYDLSTMFSYAELNMGLVDNTDYALAQVKYILEQHHLEEKYFWFEIVNWSIFVHPNHDAFINYAAFSFKPMP